MQVYLNNDLEHLAQLCCTQLQKPVEASLYTEHIIVHSQGMARWLQCAIAKEIGIAAHISFLFPGHFLQRLMNQDDETTLDPWHSEQLTWRILNLIQEQKHPEIQRYINGQNASTKAYQLARSLSETFDKYRLYRPQQLQEWANQNESKTNHWQVAVFKQLATEFDPFAQQRELENSILNGAADKLPKRVFIFGMSSLAPYYVDAFSKLATRIPVSLYSLSPSFLYIGDLVSKKYLNSLSEAGQITAEQHYDIGNSLIAQCGMNTCEFQILLDSAHAEIVETDWAEPNDDTLLQRLNSDMFLVQEPGPDTSYHQLDAQDLSVQIHNCHSPLRELETLRDFLIRSIKQNPEIKAGDIIVMSPKPELYAPYIDAVFNYMQDGNELPISFADQHHQQTQMVLDTFLACCSCVTGRLEKDQVLDLLHNPCVQQRWGWTQDDMSSISSLLDQAGILWGRDASHRETLGLGNYNDFSWQLGLQRLLISMLHGNDDGHSQPFHNILPLDSIDQTRSDLLQKVIHACTHLLQLHQRCAYSKEATDWQTLLLKVLDFIAEENEFYTAGFQLLRSTINKTMFAIQAVNPKIQLNAELIIQHLSKQCQQQNEAMGFYDGRITFSGLKPMRSIPFKVMCLIGMNENEFPRHNKEWDLDLTCNDARRIGDRDLNFEDRQLFLEVLLSCKEKLYFSYCGQNARDQQQSPPAHIVEEFIDHCALTCNLSRDAFLKQCLFQHHLHPTHASYRDPANPLQTQSSLFYLSNNSQTSKHQFLKHALSPLSSSKNIDLATFIQFWNSPSAYFLKQQYSIQPRSPRGDQSTQLEFSWNSLDLYQIREHLFQNQQSSQLERMHAQNFLPIHAFGDALFEQNAALIERFTAAQNEIRLHRDFHYQFADYHIQASQIALKDEQTALHILPHSLSTKRRLGLWLTHVFLNSSAAIQSSIIYYEKNQLKLETWQALSDAAATLDQLIAGFDLGQHQPLAFFPDSSYSFADALAKGKTPAQAQEAAYNKWTNTFNGPAESQQAHLRFCWPQTHQCIRLDDFKEYAKLVWGSHVAARQSS